MSPHHAPSLDPIELEVMRHACQAVAEEMGVTLLRTARSPNIKDRRDASTAIYLPDGRLVAQAEHIPLHLGMMPYVVESVLAHRPLHRWRPGDTVMMNDPYISGSHLPDICLVRAVFAGERPLALVANLAHHVDVGGAFPGSMSVRASEIFQEGVRIPPTLIEDRGRLREDVVELLAANLRTPATFRGDLAAQLASNETGCRRLAALGQQYGWTYLATAMEALMAYSERRMRQGIRTWPDGSYAFEDVLEGDGLTDELLSLAATLTIRHDAVEVDFAGTAAQARGSVNATVPVAAAAVFYAVKAVIDPQAPSNDGVRRPISLQLPPGSLVNPRFPAPVANANINTAQRIADVIFGALAQADPDRVPAASSGTMSNFTIGGTVGDQDHAYYSYVETYGGGQGAQRDADGADGVHTHMTNTFNTPVEVMEQAYPVRVERYGFVPGSAGAGRWRGGAGLCRAVRILAPQAAVTVSTDRTHNRPWGLAGGGDGGRSQLYLLVPAGEDGEDAPGWLLALGRQLARRRLPSPPTRPRLQLPGTRAVPLPGKVSLELPQGTVIVLETAGGGGYGRALLRAPEAVLRDVVAGLISRQTARTQYGVVLAAGGTQLHRAATAALRRHQDAGSMRRSRGNP